MLAEGMQIKPSQALYCQDCQPHQRRSVFPGPGEGRGYSFSQAQLELVQRTAAPTKASQSYGLMQRFQAEMSHQPSPRQRELLLVPLRFGWLLVT